MIRILLASAILAFQSPTLSPQAAKLIDPVAEALSEEHRRQAALPAPLDDRERLERMGALDQAGRRALGSVDLSSLSPADRQAAAGAMWTTLSAVDHQLLDDLLSMIPPEGWFLKSVYGDRASKAAFLIVQHSDIEQWRRFLPVFELLVTTGEVDGEAYGLMYDRLADHEGRLQRYGTQMTCRQGRWVVDREHLEDPDTMEARRQALGFRWTLADYEQSFAQQPPCDTDPD